MIQYDAIYRYRKRYIDIFNISNHHWTEHSVTPLLTASANLTARVLLTRGLIYKTLYDNRKIVVKSSQLYHIFVINQQVTVS